MARVPIGNVRWPDRRDQRHNCSNELGLVSAPAGANLGQWRRVTSAWIEVVILGNVDGTAQRCRGRLVGSNLV